MYIQKLQKISVQANQNQESGAFSESHSRREEEWNVRDMDEQDLDWHDLDRIAKRIMKRAGIKCRPLALQPGVPHAVLGKDSILPYPLCRGRRRCCRDLFPAAVRSSLICVTIQMKGRAINQARQFGQGLLINLAFEFDHGLEFHPILIPAPGIKFGANARAEGDIAVTSHQAQQVPYLFLSFIVSPPVPFYPLIGNFVAQPVPRAADYLDMAGMQAYLFRQFPIHCLFRAFSRL